MMRIRHTITGGARSRLRAAAFMAAWVAMIPAAAAERPYRFLVEAEVGPVWQSRNDVQIPNDETGTRFSLNDVTGDGPWAAARVRFAWNINERHGLRFLAAPLRIDETGTLDEPVDFAGASFSPDAATRATYRFNSWRATYRYRFHAGERWRWWVGFTAKVRDAKIRLQQGDTIAEDSDVGFVPLLYLRGEWRFAPKWSWVLDLDALAGGPGRAEDVLLAVRYDVGERWSLTGGYRTVEGGADVEDVYNFAWFHYAVVSAGYRF